jgi:HD superfamily phosphodiesterase
MYLSGQDQQKIANFVENYVFTVLEKGDPRWDKPHAQAAAYHTKNILVQNPDYKLDPVVMTLAAYLHDIGYSKFYKQGKSLTRDVYMEAKKQHMDIGVQIAGNLLQQIKLTNKQKKQILHLIQMHDRLDLLTQKDELVLMEADTLGALDVNFIKPTFNTFENTIYLQSVTKNRLPKFITDYSKKQFNILSATRDKYYLQIDKSS